jgi:hypothetical protein
VTAAPAHPALDLGTAIAKIARDGASEPDTCPTPAQDWPARIRAALQAAGIDGSVDGLCLAVPDAWLDGSVAGSTAQEALRHACQDELGITQLTWSGQLAAVAALVAERDGPGRYLVCDLGAEGVRTALLDVAGSIARIVTVHEASGGGWRDFDAALRSRLPDMGQPLPADWYRSAKTQDRRARAVLSRAISAPAWRESPAYTVIGSGGELSLLAGQVLDCFAPTEQRIRAGAAQVLGADPPLAVVLTGGFGWFPLAAQALAEVAGATVVIVEGPAAAARGTLLFGRGSMRMAPPPALAQVALPVHQVSAGVLTEASLELPWTEAFASPADGPLMLDGPELTVDIAGRRATIGLPGLAPGPCRVGVRPGWSGSCALVVRPDGRPGAPVVVRLDVAAAGRGGSAGVPGA